MMDAHYWGLGFYLVVLVLPGFRINENVSLDDIMRKRVMNPMNVRTCNREYSLLSDKDLFIYLHKYMTIPYEQEIFLYLFCYSLEWQYYLPILISLTRQSFILNLFF